MCLRSLQLCLYSFLSKFTPVYVQPNIPHHKNTKEFQWWKKRILEINMKTEPLDEGSLSHACALHGCVQILEMISTAVALICSFLNRVWLTAAGGGFVVFALIVCLIFSAVFFTFHLVFDITGWLKCQMAEWIGYLCGVGLLLISLAVSISASTKQYLEETSDGRKRLVESSPITVTAVFVTLAMLFYLVHAVQLSLLRIRNRKKAKPDSKSKKSGTQANSAAH